MEDRVQGIEQALQQAVQQLAAMQVQQAQTEQQLCEAREAAGKGVRAGKGGVSLNLRVGMVLNGLDKGPLKDHLLLNSAKYLTWQEFKSEIVNYQRATQAVADNGGVAPMDVGAFTKGDKGRGRGAGKGTQDQTCHNCGRRGHFKKDCKKPGGGAHWPDSRAKAKPKSKGKGKGWKGQNRDKKTVNAVEDDDEEEYHNEEEQEQPENEEGRHAEARIHSWTTCRSHVSEIFSPARNYSLNMKTRWKVNLACSI